MSLIKCIDCGNDISDKAEICPVCGRKYQVKTAFKSPKSMSKKAIIFTVIAVLALILIICDFATPNRDVSSEVLNEKLGKHSYNNEQPVAKTEKEMAVGKAKSYLDVSAFSYKGMVEQLEFEGFSEADAKYGADHCGANWKEQAKKKAASYLKISDFSRTGLIDQLEYEGFTFEQAVYGVEQNGL